jgi:hypothetical protein
MRLYVVSQDKKSGLYYIHTKGYAYIPVLGSFTESKAEARKMAATYSGFTKVKEYTEALRRAAK